MTIRTDINPSYLIRLSIVTVMCVGMCLYCIYDGTVRYPEQAKYANQYQQFRDDNPDMSEKEHATKWNETEGKKHGWVASKLKKPRTKYEINSQFFMAFLTGLIGLFFLGKLLGNKGCWVEATEEGLLTSERRQVRYEDIQALDKKKWQNKGIAYVQYESEGKQKKILIDDCNYVRDTTNEILRLIEKKIGPDKIINGKPEPPPKDQQATEDSVDDETQSFQGEPTKV